VLTQQSLQFKLSRRCHASVS